MSIQTATAPCTNPEDSQLFVDGFIIDNNFAFTGTSSAIWPGAIQQWPPYGTGTTIITNKTAPFEADKEGIDELFPIEDSALDEVAAAIAKKGPSTYFQGPPRLPGACPPGQHEFELMAEEGLNILAGQRQRLVLYCHKCGTTVRHDISAPQEDTDDQSLPDD